MHRPKQKYRLSDDAQTLLDEFLKTLIRDANTTYDYSWVIRRYLNYLRGIGITDVTMIKQSDLAGFILIPMPVRQPAQIVMKTEPQDFRFLIQWA